MPYILQESKIALMNSPRRHAAVAGELNFLITNLLIQYIEEHGLGYNQINDCIGALSAADYEFKRRVLKPYEKKKCEENGDVYPPNLTNHK